MPLIALGFVLIYKATEVVNFAQRDDFMMFGGFAVLTFSEGLGLGFWPGLVCACLAMGLAGYLVDSLIMRPNHWPIAGQHIYSDSGVRIHFAISRWHDLGLEPNVARNAIRR